MDDVEKRRNSITFRYPAFRFEEYKAREKDREEMRPLISTLTSMKPLPNDCSERLEMTDYEDVGMGPGFQSELLKGAKAFNTDFPSLLRLCMPKATLVDKFRWNEHYKKCMLRIPGCKEDRDMKELEAFVEKFAKSKKNELFVKYPYSIEGEVISFQNLKDVFKI